MKDAHLINHLHRDLSRELSADPVRLADACYVLRWIMEKGPETIPQNIYEFASRAVNGHDCKKRPTR